MDLRKNERSGLLMLFNYTHNEVENQYDSDDAVAGADVRSTADGGDLKYLNNKVIFVRPDGSYSMVDNGALRLNRLNKRLRKWEDIVRDAIRFESARVFREGLSYRPSEHWAAHHITEYIANVRRYVGDDSLLAYAWVAEVQERGEVHYHSLMVTDRECRKIRLPDKSGEWTHGSSNREEISYLEVGYLTSEYMRKKEQKSNYPRGIRTHSAWLNDKFFDGCDLWALRSASYPEWLVDKINHAGLINPIITRAKGGGWTVRACNGGDELYYKNDENIGVYVGQKAVDFMELEKRKYPIPF